MFFGREYILVLYNELVVFRLVGRFDDYRKRRVILQMLGWVYHGSGCYVKGPIG